MKARKHEISRRKDPHRSDAALWRSDASTTRSWRRRRLDLTGTTSGQRAWDGNGMDSRSHLSEVPRRKGHPADVGTRITFYVVQRLCETSIRFGKESYDRKEEVHERGGGDEHSTHDGRQYGFTGGLSVVGER